MLHRRRHPPRFPCLQRAIHVIRPAGRRLYVLSWNQRRRGHRGLLSGHQREAAWISTEARHAVRVAADHTDYAGFISEISAPAADSCTRQRRAELVEYCLTRVYHVPGMTPERW